MMLWYALILLLPLAVASSEESCSEAKPCMPGLVLPVWQPQHGLHSCTIVFRAIVYLVALFYMFFGVSIVADRFMAAIEVITSQTREIKMRKITGEPYTINIRVWNETVSNLTLMALGSSAPEILLSVIEIFGNNFEAGDLGPGTIVGSAAFNLYIIIAICILSIPSGEVRRVQNNGVFWVTVLWSTFAYIWLYLILNFFSPNVVEVWEGVLTFLFFPVTVLTAYYADVHTGKFGRRILTNNVMSFFRKPSTPHRTPRSPVKSAKNESTLENGTHDEEHKMSLLNLTNDADVAAFEEHRKMYLQIFRELRAEHPDAPVVELEKFATERLVSKQKKSRAFYRIQATHKLAGSGDIVKKKLKKKTEQIEEEVLKKPNMVVVEFDPAHYMCLENIGKLKLKVKVDRGSTDPNNTVTVHYRTVADTAQEHSDFIPVEGILTFKSGEDEQEIEVEIVDNDIYEDDEQFLVRLSQVRCYNNVHFSNVPCRLGAASTATVLIVDDDHAGAFGFSTEKFKVSESAGEFVAEVMRTRGARGKVSIPYKTVDGMAKSPDDYQHQEGILEFEDEQTSAVIRIPIVSDDEYEKNEDFFIELGEPVWLDGVKEGEEGWEGRPTLSMGRCRVVITEDKEFKNIMDMFYQTTTSTFMVGTSSWKEQFKDAVTLERDDDGNVSCMDRFLHCVAFPWKILFALIPPTDYFKGWLCFVVSIIMIGVLTAVIGDLASHFGCTVGLKDSVTAFSLVAMGTSVPDTFASRTAAVQDAWADSSIGNVTGSNAVNVFLGIGIAWAIASIYHYFNGTQFRVHAGSLAFSVTMFLIGSCICIALLQYRRFNKKIGGELGGPVSIKYLSTCVFVLVWVLYLTMSTLEAYCIIPGF